MNASTLSATLLLGTNEPRDATEAMLPPARFGPILRQLPPRANPALTRLWVVCDSAPACAELRELFPAAQLTLISRLPFTSLLSESDGKIFTWIDQVVGLPDPKPDAASRRILDALSSRVPLSPATNMAKTRVACSLILQHSSELSSIYRRVESFIAQMRLSAPIMRAARAIAEELVMNALYDAPVASGNPEYQLNKRTDPVRLAPEHAASLHLEVSGPLLLVEACDPFGLFEKEKFHRYAKKIARSSSGNVAMDAKTLGAGLGLFKMLNLCHGVVCRVEPRHRTVVSALIDTRLAVRDVAKMARSIVFEDATVSQKAATDQDLNRLG